MIGLFDRDIFLKLSCCDLWDEAIEALGVTTAYRLISTSNSKSNAKALARMLRGQDHTAALTRAQDIAARVATLPDDLADGILTNPIYRLLQGIENIDGGEQLLATIVLQGRADLLLTGDKRFIRALRHGAPDQWSAIKRSLVSFELCILSIVKYRGFGAIKNRVNAMKQCDGSLKITVGDQFEEASFVDGLLSFDPMIE